MKALKLQKLSSKNLSFENEIFRNLNCFSLGYKLGQKAKQSQFFIKFLFLVFVFIIASISAISADDFLDTVATMHRVIFF